MRLMIFGNVFALPGGAQLESVSAELLTRFHDVSRKALFGQRKGAHHARYSASHHKGRRSDRDRGHRKRFDECRARRPQLGENIVIAWPSRTSLPWQGLGKGRRIRLTEEDLETLRREVPEATFSGEYERDKSAFRKERVRITPQISANSPMFAVMRNIIPASGGR
jgi:hypothetical protein